MLTFLSKILCDLDNVSINTSDSTVNQWTHDRTFLSGSYPCYWLYLTTTCPLWPLSGFISTLRSITKLPAVPWVICTVPSTLAELLWFHHSCRSNHTERLVRLSIQQMCPALDLCVFYWLWPSVNTVAGSSSCVCWCTQTGELSARRNIQQRKRWEIETER